MLLCLARNLTSSQDQAFGLLELDWQGHVEIDPRYLRPAEVDVLQGDASKAGRELGWRPKVGFEDLVRMMVDADLATLDAPDPHPRPATLNRST